MKSRRIGKFAMTIEALESFDDIILSAVFFGVRILKAEPDLASQRIVYTAMNNLFDEIEQFERPPWYSVYISQDNDEMIRATYHRCYDPLQDYEEIPKGYGNGVIRLPNDTKLVDVYTGEVILGPRDKKDLP